ncbi:MAG: HAMP domain-containing histidine kinase [Acidobacteria bacterium]|nr:HAMP domain-containing histidine kinase [Acidobacteriota bacterium]
MFERFLARLRSHFHHGEPKDHASVLVPLLIIAVALGVLAWRSYVLSIRFEGGATALAQQYASYAADVTAGRVDSAVASEFFRVYDEWQQVERRSAEPNTAAFREWLSRHEWIVNAIYIPDADPANSIFVSEIGHEVKQADGLLTREFYTSSGVVRYTYDPARLLARVQAVVRLQPLGSKDAVQPRADITLTREAAQRRLVALPDAVSFTSPLAAPLDGYGIRAVVKLSYIGTGWENQRTISLLLSAFALVLTFLGAYLASRGLRKENETMKLRGALIANVSHELRTPLSMIRLGAETLKRGSKLKPKERDEIEDQILREVLHLSHLVENVLDIARLQHKQEKAMAFTPVYPRELVTTLVSTYESWIRSKGFAISVHLDDAVGEQMWDREAVSRALLNLIDNAIKYSADEKKLEVVLLQTPKDVLLEVRDHGIGIAAKDLERIFDPYFRAQFSDTQTRRGAGLGLTLVQQITAAHGGRVEVESQPNVGSTFRLLFPRFAAEEARPVTNLLHAPGAF